MLLLPLALVAATGCGSDEEPTSGEEGEFVHVGETLYQVQLTRLLNPHQRPDDSLLKGQVAAPADEVYLAVFLTIENNGDEPYSPPRDMKVVDTVGNEYLPLAAGQSGFELDFGEPLNPEGVAPPANSPADLAMPGALLLFRVKQESATNNLPLELEVPSGGKSISRIELDV